jgi:hypothetical protein
MTVPTFFHQQYQNEKKVYQYQYQYDGSGVWRCDRACEIPILEVVCG